MEVVLAILGVVLAPVVFGFAYGMLMNAGIDPIDIGGDAHE